MIVSTLPIEHRIKHLQPIFTIARGSRFIATGGLNGEMKLWSFDYSLIKTIQKHRGSISTIRFSRDGKYLASAGDDGYVYVFDTATTSLVHTIKHSIDVTHVQWSNEYLFSSDLNGLIFVTRFPEFSEFKRLKHPHGAVTGLAVSGDGESLVAYAEGTIIIFRELNVSSKAQTERGTILESLNSRLSFSPDNRLFSVGLQFNNKTPTVDLFDVKTLVRQCSLVGHVSVSEISAFHPSFFRLPDGSIHTVLAVASQDLSLSFWSSANPYPFLLLKNVTQAPVLDMYWHGSELVICSYCGLTKSISFGEAFGIPVGPEAISDTFLPFCLTNIALSTEPDSQSDSAYEAPGLLSLIIGDNNKGKEDTSFVKNVDEPDDDKEVDEDVIKIKTDNEENKNSLEACSVLQNIPTEQEAQNPQHIEPKRITPFTIKGAPVSSITPDRSIVLFDVALPEKLHHISSQPFKVEMDVYTFETNSSLQSLIVKRDGRLFFSLPGPINKVCFNAAYLVLYSKTLQVYDMPSGTLLLPHITVRAAFVDLLESRILVVSTCGDFTVIDILKKKCLISGRLPKTKGLLTVILDKAYFIVATYRLSDGSEDRLYYSLQLASWLSIAPTMNSVATHLTDYLNDRDDTGRQIEASFVAAKFASDTQGMRHYLLLFIKFLSHAGISLDNSPYEHTLLRMLKSIKNKRLIRKALRRLNKTLRFQRFVEGYLAKQSLKGHQE